METRQYINRPIKMDFHVHTNYSPDSTAKMESMIEAAIKNNITDLAITDHVDLDADLEGTALDWNFDRNQFEREILRYKDLYRHKINLYQGLELGIQPHLASENTKIVRENTYDFVIASIHSVERRDLYNKKFFNAHSDRNSVSIYYKEMLESIRAFDDYSVLGHMDLYLRYKPELSKVAETEYLEIVDEIFKHLIYNGKGLEINAGGYRYGLGHNNPHERLLKRYRELKGEILTIGSDAHTPERVGTMAQENIELMRNIGFKYICTFEQMKPIFHKI